MKRNNIIFSALTALAIFAVSCSKDVNSAPTPQPEEGATAEKVVITASLPEVPMSKVAMEETATGLDLKWAVTDFLTVVCGDVVEKYTIDTISEDGKSATFTGNPVEGDSFTVIYSDLGVDYATRNLLSDSRPDNGTDLTGKLPYDAVLENVKNYTQVSFTESWAQANGAKFSQTGCLMLYLQLPEECDNVNYVKLFAYDNVFSKTNAEGCDKGSYKPLRFNSPKNLVDGCMKAYYTTSMNEDVIPAGTHICVLVETGDNLAFCKKYVFPAGATLKPGKRNVLKLNSSGWNQTGLQTWQNDDDRAKWTAPYANMTHSGNGPAKMINNVKTDIWEYPYNANHTVVDSSFDEWSREQIYDDGRGAAPFVAIINLGDVTALNTIQLWPRYNNNNAKYLTIGEVWVSVDTSNDEGFEAHLSQNLTNNIVADNIQGYWGNFWSKKQWIKVADFDTEGKRGDSGGQRDMNIQGYPAKYVMVKCLDNGLYSSNLPVLSVAEVFFKLYR